MKKLIFLAFILLLMPGVLAADLDVEKIPREKVIFAEKDNPATYTLKITNNEATDNFEIYSLVGVTIEPKSLFQIQGGETKTLEIQIHPHERTRNEIKGVFVFEYEIKGRNTGFFKDRLDIKIIDLKDALSISIGEITPESDEAVLTIKNLENMTLDDLSFDLNSRFIDFSETISLDSFERKTYSIPIKEESKDLNAGTYSFIAELKFDDLEDSASGEIRYLEKSGVFSSEETSGLISRKITTLKTNEGNVPVGVEITKKRDVLTRLFTTYSEKPTNSEREGFFVEYVWAQELEPRESLAVTSTTNYTIPFSILIFVIVVILVVKVFLQTNLSLTKRVSFVKTKGGEFALKVIIQAKARKPIENIKIIDRLPPMANLYEKFGTKPDKIDEKSRRIFWSIKSLKPGEQRIFSYVIYSKIKVVGQYELPAARGLYDKDGKTFEVYSNKTSFMSETTHNLAD